MSNLLRQEMGRQRKGLLTVAERIDNCSKTID